MSRDRISIQEVRLVAEREPLALDHATYQEVVNCSTRSAMRLSGRSVVRAVNVEYWLSREGIVRSGLEEYFHDYVHAHSTALAVYGRQLDDIRNSVDGINDPANLPPELFNLWLPIDISTVDNANRSLAEVIEDVDRCSETVAKILKVASSWSDGEKTGNLLLDVTLLNSGDTDGLVQPEGTLAITGLSGAISIVLAREYLGLVSPTSPYELAEITSIRVGRRSMAALRFTVDASDSTGNAITELAARVNAGTPMSYSIEFSDIRGDAIAWEDRERIVQ